MELREKIERFGLKVVGQATDDTDFDKNKLLYLKDAELLSLCLKLNIITEDGHFFLNQCRDTRNNFSAAHPAMGKIDGQEFLAFANRCAKYALGSEINPVGVDISSFVSALKTGRFTEEQKITWTRKLARTHEAQQQLMFGMLHGIYCDPASSEEARLNTLAVAMQSIDLFTPTARSELIVRHQEYVANGDEKRKKASQIFFRSLKMLDILDEFEQHSLISNACKKLMSVHQAIDNFYNEPPFADRLSEISTQFSVPESAQNEFVITVATCAVGNPYGVSHAAWPHYRQMIQNFSPAEVSILLMLPESRRTEVGTRIANYDRCRSKFKEIVGLLNMASIPAKAKRAYRDWVPKQEETTVSDS